MSVFGAKIAIVYVIVGLILAVVGGTIIDKLRMEDQVIQFTNPGSSIDIEVPELSKKERMIYAKEQVQATVKKVILYIFIGVGIGALIHNWIPTEVIQKILGKDNPFSVLIATIVGVPMYADIFGTISNCGSTISKRSRCWNHPVIYDGCNSIKFALDDYVKKSSKTEIISYLHWNCYRWIIIIGYLLNAVGFLLI